MSVQLQALADEVFDAGAALDLFVPAEMRPVASVRSETQVAMVQAFTENPSPDGGRSGRGFTVLTVRDDEGWAAFEGLIHAAGAEQGRTPEMIALFRWRAANTPDRFYLAYQGDRAVAHVGLYQHRSSAYLHDLFTHPEYRRRGTGSYLALAMGSEARSVGCERVVLQCPRDSGLPAYFERLGFRTVGERQTWTKTE